MISKHKMSPKVEKSTLKSMLSVALLLPPKTPSAPQLCPLPPYLPYFLQKASPSLPQPSPELSQSGCPQKQPSEHLLHLTQHLSPFCLPPLEVSSSWGQGRWPVHCSPGLAHRGQPMSVSHDNSSSSGNQQIEGCSPPTSFLLS